MDTTTTERKKVNVEVGRIETKDRKIKFVDLIEWVEKMRQESLEAVDLSEVTFYKDGFDDDDYEVELTVQYDREETEEEELKRTSDSEAVKAWMELEKKKRAWWELVQNLKSNPEFFDRIEEAMK